MQTRGEAFSLKQNVNSYLAMMLVGSVALWAGLQIWHVAHGSDPLSNAFAASIIRAQGIEVDF